MEYNILADNVNNLSDIKFAIWALVTVAVAWINNKSNKKEKE